MLVNHKYERDDVVTFKLVNGDEIVAKVAEETEKSFVISKPCTVMPSQRGIGLLQSLFTSELSSNITLDKTHVMFHAPTQKEVESHYIQTTTGIQPASSIVT